MLTLRDYQLVPVKPIMRMNRPDARDFAKDKPLTLINGSELLHLLQNHGYDFKIELQKKRRRQG